MKKNIIIVVLIFVVIGLCGYIIYNKQIESIEPITEEELNETEIENKEVNFNLDDISCAFIWLRDVDNINVRKILFAWDLATHDNTIDKIDIDDASSYFENNTTGNTIISASDFFNKYKEVWAEEMTTTKFKSLLTDIASYTYPMQISDNGYILGNHATGGFSEEEVKVTEVSREYLSSDEMLIKISVEYIDAFNDYPIDTSIYYDTTIKINDDKTYSFISIEQN
jgi:hypothetical protein